VLLLVQVQVAVQRAWRVSDSVLSWQLLEQAFQLLLAVLLLPPCPCLQLLVS
jgi:hypothetical protein